MYVIDSTCQQLQQLFLCLRHQAALHQQALCQPWQHRGLLTPLQRQHWVLQRRTQPLVLDHLHTA